MKYNKYVISMYNSTNLKFKNINNFKIKILEKKVENIIIIWH